MNEDLCLVKNEVNESFHVCELRYYVGKQILCPIHIAIEESTIFIVITKDHF